MEIILKVNTGFGQELFLTYFQILLNYIASCVTDIKMK